MKSVIAHKELLQSLSSRYATKQFDPTKKISEADWKVLTESLRLSPSSYGLQPWKFILVENPDLRKKLRAAAWNQSQVEEASHFLVFATLKNVDETYIKKFIEKTAHDRGTTPDTLKGFSDMLVTNVAKRDFDHLSWTQRQSYIAMGFLGLSAALLGIDTCMMEGFDPNAFNNILGLDNSPYATVAAMALGYRSEEDKYAHATKSRFEESDVIEVL